MLSRLTFGLFQHDLLWYRDLGSRNFSEFACLNPVTCSKLSCGAGRRAVWCSTTAVL